MTARAITAVDLPTWQIHQGDAIAQLAQMPDESINCCVTSPPYFGLRDYGCPGQIGLEPTPAAFVAKMVEVFDQVRRVLKADGTLWLNLGDSYAGSGKGGNPADSPYQKQATNAGSITVIGNTARIAANTKLSGDDRTFGFKPKDMLGIPWRVAFALQEAGWYLRQDIIWAKPNPMPESVKDRCTKAHEYLFLLSKSPRYYYNAEAIKEPGVYCGPNTGVGFGHGYDVEIKPRSVGGWATGNGSHSVLEHNTADGRRAERKRGTLRPNKGLDDKWDSMPRKEQCGSLRNKRSVWTVATHPFPDAHFATFPPELIRPCILAGCPEGGTVLDPFTGAGTTGMVSVQHGRNFVGIELNPKYVEMASRRIAADAGFMAVENPVGLARALCGEVVR